VCVWQLPFEQRNDRHLPHRAGHVHAGVYLVLVMLRYVDEAVLSPFWKWLPESVHSFSLLRFSASEWASFAPHGA